MTINYVKPIPTGVNPPLEMDRMPVSQVVNGDTLTLRTRATIEGKGVSPENSKLTFKLINQKFDKCAVWTGTWDSGICKLDDAGLIEIKIPDSISAKLRRGDFIYSLLVTDMLGNYRRTVMEGSLLVDYDPTSPLHDIPYKDPPYLPQADGPVDKSDNHQYHNNQVGM